MKIPSLATCLLTAALASTAVVAGYFLAAPDADPLPVTTWVEPKADVPCCRTHEVFPALVGEMDLMDKAPTIAPNDLELVLSEPGSDAAFAAACRLAGRGAEVLPEVMAALHQAATPEQARLLATILARIGTEDAVEAMWNAAVAQTDPAMRQAFADAMDSLSSEEGITLLVSALAGTQDPIITQAAIRTLSRAARADTIHHLMELYVSQPNISSQRSQLVAALESIAAPVAVPALGEAVRAWQTPELSLAAARSLTKMGTTASVQALRDAILALPVESDAAQVLRQRLIDLFASVRVTAENAPLLTDMADHPPSSLWTDATRVLALRAQPLLAMPAAPGPQVRHYIPVQK